MKKINFCLIILLLQFSQICFSQIGSSFEKGFNEGYVETLRDAKIIGRYPEYADSRLCESKNLYVNDSKANEKLYADGYRCGVSQGLKAVVKIENISSNTNTKKNYDNTSISSIQNEIEKLQKEKKKHIGGTADAINAQISGLEHQKSNLIMSEQTINNAKARLQEDYSDTQERNLEENKRIQTNNYNQEVLKQLKQNQIQSQNNYN